MKEQGYRRGIESEYLVDSYYSNNNKIGAKGGMQSERH